ncbi:hypothetical protein KIL84_004692 [Mauremys mutica]|uniref:RING-type E3 ubiquitin transferase n=1 Tax=Mauremys mutica TaxID=74926 RepID=A0A9D3XQ61_9SAUR|nr:hypothetical protein KIL84_004692 [Mauremys mutica]
MAAANPAQLLLGELTCAVCLDYFKDPVSLDCGHHFCQACITRCWEELSADFPCPECRETFSRRNLKPNRQLRNIVEASRTLTLKSAKEPEVGTVCEKHNEDLKVFCQEDQTPICVVCHLSRDHRDHTVVPIEEAAEDYKTHCRLDCGSAKVTAHPDQRPRHITRRYLTAIREANDPTSEPNSTSTSSRNPGIVTDNPNVQPGDFHVVGPALTPKFEIEGEGDCVYLNNNYARIGGCSLEKHWICSKQDGYTARKQNAP